jgi:hypothetical protein
MRSSKLPVLGSLLLLSACLGYGRTSMGVSADLGPGVDLYEYSSQDYGDWHANYRQWTPVVVYEVNGRYYPNNVRGARQVQVYRSQSQYFLPPRDQEWTRTDRRFKSKRMPNDTDYGRARPRSRPRP